MACGRAGPAHAAVAGDVTSGGRFGERRRAEFVGSWHARYDVASMEKPGLVIFDCDGVLVDSELLNNQALSELLAGHGLALTPEEAVSHFKGLSNPDTVAKVRSDWGIVLPQDFMSRLEAAEWAMMETGLQPVPGALEAVAAVARSGAALCVASSGTPDAILQRLTITGLLPYFRGRLFSAQQVARGKPSPDLFLHVASEIGFAPDQCVVVEDSLPGVRAGIAAGMPVFAYAARGGAAELRTAGGFVFTEMAELPPLLGV